MVLQIDDSRLRDNLSKQIKRVIRVMFSDYEKTIVLSEFTDGLSSGRVFIVRPIQSNGPELHSVVKVDFVEAIQQEWEAYQACIQHKLPRTAVIRGDPVYPPGNAMGGLWYSLAGDGVFEIISLAEYARQAKVTEIEKVLKRLLQSLDRLWGHQKYVEPDLYLRTVYDTFLPANLFIEAATPSEGEEVHWLHPNTIRKRQWEVGEYVLISGFYPVEKDPKENQLILNMNGTTSFRLKLQSPIGIEEYEVGQEIYEPIYGRISQTRTGFLLEKIVEVVGSKERATQSHFTSADGMQLPNPFIALETLLEQSSDAYKACLHGDLHLKNILVEPNSGEVHLIDFGKSGRDYIMRDLLHLEMSILTELLTGKLPSNDRLSDTLYEFYKTLHCAIVHSKIAEVPGNAELPFTMLVQLRETARHYLFKANQWDFYYSALCLHLLGALKFSSLSHAAKQLAFWGSVAILKMLQDPPDCSPLDMSGERTKLTPADPDERQPTSKYNITIKGGQGVIIGDHNQVTQTFTERTQKRIASTNSAVISLELAIDYHQFTLEEQSRFIADLSRIIGTDPDDVCVLAIDSGSVMITIEVPEEAAAILVSMFLREDIELRTLQITKVESSHYPIKEKLANMRPDERGRCSKVDLEHIDLTKLRECIVIYFNESEIKDVCFDLQVDYESLSGQGKSDKARELVAFFKRRGQIDELVSLLCQQRPKIAILDLLK